MARKLWTGCNASISQESSAWLHHIRCRKLGALSKKGAHSNYMREAKFASIALGLSVQATLSDTMSEQVMLRDSTS